MMKLTPIALLIMAIAVIPVSADIVINEIMPNPSEVSDSYGEWFEVYNNGTTDVDMNGWTIMDLDYDDHLIDNGGPLMVPAGGFLVFGRNADILLNGGYECDYEYGNDIALANSSDEILLMDADSVIVDSVIYDRGEGWYLPNGGSMSLINFNMDNNDPAAWHDAHIMTFGDGDYGTPGMENEPYFDIIISNAPDSVMVGDNLTFDVYVANPSPYAETVDIWGMVQSDPISKELINYSDITLPSGFSTTAGLSFGVPTAAPLGPYTFIAFMGDYDTGDIWYSDEFDFEIVGR